MVILLRLFWRHAGAAHFGGPQIRDPKRGAESRVERNGKGTGTEDVLGAGGEAPPVNGATSTPDGQASNGSAHTPLGREERHHHLIDIPELEVATGEVTISPDERAEIEEEAPAIAKPVEEMAEDRSWLSHNLLNARTIFSFALALGIIVFIFTQLDINPLETWRTMISADPLMLVAGLVVYYSAFWLRAARWRMLLNNVGFEKREVKLPNINGLVEIIYLSWFVNCIVPAKLGDAYRSYLLKRNAGVSFSSTIGTILAERVVDLLVLFGLLVASFAVIGRSLYRSGDFDLNVVMLMGAAMVLLLVSGLAALRFYGHLLVRLVPGRFKEKFTQFQQGILRSFKRRGLPLLLGYTVLIWLLEGARLFFVTRSLDAHAVTLSAVIFIALLSSLLTTIPATPGGIGVVEGGVTLALGLFLNDHQLAVSIALLDRIINYWSLVVGGLVLYLISRRK